MAAESDTRLATLQRFALASALGHATWETLQLPLYAIWFDGAPAQIAFAVVHCTGGDLSIAGATIALALLTFGRHWPADSVAYLRVATAAIAAGIAYTIFSEWLNVNIRQTWAYSAWMPRLPPLGTGLSPVAQWLIVPAIAFRWARPNS